MNVWLGDIIELKDNQIEAILAVDENLALKMKLEIFATKW